MFYAEQFDLNLPGDEGVEFLFAACTNDESCEDLHLVAWASPRKTTVNLLCGKCRAEMPERFTLSIPVSLLSLSALTQLEVQGKLPEGDQVVRSLRDALAADLSATWEVFRGQNAQREAGLSFDLPDELGLR